MDDLKFNIYAFVKPQTKEEFSTLLEEAIRIAQDLEESWDAAIASLRRDRLDK